MDNDIKAITEAIKQTVDCEKIFLFGSYAYGEPDENSDLDFYVVIPDDSSMRPIEAMRVIRKNIRQINRGTPVDILAARSSRFAEMSALPTMERKIAKDGVVLYEQNGLGQRMA